MAYEDSNLPTEPSADILAFPNFQHEANTLPPDFFNRLGLLKAKFGIVSGIFDASYLADDSQKMSVVALHSKIAASASDTFEAATDTECIEHRFSDHTPYYGTGSPDVPFDTTGNLALQSFSEDFRADSRRIAIVEDARLNVATLLDTAPDVTDDGLQSPQLGVIDGGLHDNALSVPAREAIMPSDRPNLRVREARDDVNDLGQLVNLELSAFADVYGEKPSEEMKAGVTKKFIQRLKVLGPWVKVIEDKNSENIVGMAIGCPTNLSDKELLSQDMTSAEELPNTYDPDGKNMYIINLATHPDAPKDLRFMLFGSLLAEGFRSKCERAVFESRLPGLNGWMEKMGIDAKGLSRAEQDAVADRYWRTTVDVRGKQKPVDRLLSLYTDVGARPLELVPEAWVVDKPSSSYGVLCEYDNPLPKPLRSNRIVRGIAARALDFTVNHKTLMKGIFK